MAKSITSIYLDQKDLERLDELAKSSGVSKSEVIRQAISQFLKTS